MFTRVFSLLCRGGGIHIHYQKPSKFTVFNVFYFLFFEFYTHLQLFCDLFVTNLK